MSNVSQGANFSTPASAAGRVMRALVSYWSLTAFVIFFSPTLLHRSVCRVHEEWVGSVTPGASDLWEVGRGSGSNPYINEVDAFGKVLGVP